MIKKFGVIVMQHKCKVTVIDKKLFPDLQSKYLADPKSGVCPFYQIGDEFVFTRYGKQDDFWTQQSGKHCSEAWDCISRYVYTALQGGSIMRNWTNDERMMIACCNDGTRPVIFKIERFDYKVVFIGITNDNISTVKKLLSELKEVTAVEYYSDEGYFEVYVDKDVDNGIIIEKLKSFNVTKID